MAASPMNKQLSLKNCCSPGGCFVYSCDIAETPTEGRLRSRESLYVIGLKNWQKKGEKALDSCLFFLHHFFLNFEMRILVVNPLLYFQVVHMLPKRLRESARQHFPEGTCVPLNTMSLRRPASEGEPCKYM